MIYRRLTLFLIASLIIVAASYLFVYYQTSEAAVSVDIPLELGGVKYPGLKTTDEQIRFWEGRFERDPRDFISLTYMAGVLINKGRETGDVTAYNRAEAALEKALELDDNYELALAYLATVRFVRHDFQAALALAERVYAFDPRALQTLATIGDAQLELGNYTEAEAAYRKLEAQNPSPPVYSRLARLAWLQGDPQEALAYMQQAAAEAAEMGLAGESKAWYQFQLAELYFNTGQIEAAEQHYTAALEAFPDYYLGLVGLGKVRAVQQEYETAIKLYRQATAAVPQPDFLAVLGDLYRLTGQHEQARRQYDTVEYIGKLAEINQQIYNRQLANFYSDHDLHLDKALALATAELELRQDIYGFDTAAWAYYKNGHFIEAQEMIEQAMQLGTGEAKLYYHAGMIAQANGHIAEAEELLSKALAINPYFDLRQATVARDTLEQIRAN
jgi:tetratricopeptide (TPR) repeat protein